jgi:hypothetical protein
VRISLVQLSYLLRYIVDSLEREIGVYESLIDARTCTKFFVPFLVPMGSMK